MPGISNKDWPASRELNRESNLSVKLCKTLSELKALWGMVRIESVPFQRTSLGSQKKTNHQIENPPQLNISTISPNRAGVCRKGTLYPAAHASLRTSFISFHNLAHRAIAKHFPTSPAGLGGGVSCTTAHVCTKKGHKARRREGDKCFFARFFLNS